MKPYRLLLGIVGFLLPFVVAQSQGDSDEAEPEIFKYEVSADRI